VKLLLGLEYSGGIVTQFPLSSTWHEYRIALAVVVPPSSAKPAAPRTSAMSIIRILMPFSRHGEVA
jgi:hypothetical protein